MHALQKQADDDDEAGGDAVRLRMLDFSVVPAQKHAAGARRDGPPPQIGSIRGGRTTKIHLALGGTDRVDALVLTPGQASDCPQAETLLADLQPGTTVLGDKAYDANSVVQCIEQAGRRRTSLPGPAARSPGPLTGPSIRTAIGSSGSSAGSRNSAGLRPATTRLPAISSRPCNSLPVASCCGRWQDN